MKRKNNFPTCRGCPLAEDKYTYIADFPNPEASYTVVVMRPDKDDAFYKGAYVGKAGHTWRAFVDEQGYDHIKDFSYHYVDNCWDRGTLKESNDCWSNSVPLLIEGLPIIALGKAAGEALGVTIMDRWVRTKYGEVICIPDPSDVWKHPNDAIYLEQGIAKALKGPVYEDELPWEQLDVKIDPWPLPELNGDPGHITIDIETTSLDWTSPHGEIFLLGIHSKWGTWIFTEERLGDPETQAWLRALFSHHGNRIGGHNFKFDMKWLVSRYGVEPIIGWDTMLMTNVIHEYWYKDLKSLATYYFNAPDYEHLLVTRHKKKGMVTYAQYPRGDMIRYLTCDLYYNHMLFEELRDILLDKGQWVFPYTGHEIPQINLLLDVELRGFVIDRKRAYEEQRHFEADRLRVKEVISLLSKGEIANPNSFQQIGAHLYGTLGLQVTQFTSTGKPSTSEEALRDHMDVPIVQAIAAYRRISKLKSSYIDNLIDKLKQDHAGNYRAHTSYNAANVVTHRLSAKAPAAQTIPHTDKAKDTVPEFIQQYFEGQHVFEGDYGTRIKNLYTVPPGYSMIGVDGMSWEIWTATAQSQDPYLTEIFNRGESPHTGLCDMLYGPGWTKAQKVKEKNAFFGWLYMGSANAVAHETGLPINDIQDVMAMLEENLTQLKRWRQDTVATAMEQGFVVVPKFNYHMHYDFINHINRKDVVKQAVNYVNQGLGSMLMSRAAIAANKQLKFLSGGVIALVHDAFYAEVPNKFVPKAYNILGESVLQAAEWFNTEVKAGAELMTGTRWGDLEESMYDRA